MLGLRVCHDAIEQSLGRKREVWEIPDDENAYTFLDLWDKINAATRAQLDKQKECGILSKEEGVSKWRTLFS